MLKFPMATFSSVRPIFYFAWSIAILSIAIGPSACSKSTTPEVAEPATVILLVRHAERLSVSDSDSPLSPAGEARARELLHVMRGANLKKIYSSEYRRVMQTVQPLADALGLPIDSERKGPDLSYLVKDILTNHRGETVLVAHHLNTLPEIIRLLGGGEVPPFDEREYDRLYVVHHRKDGVSITTLRYGAEFQR